jgi:hypothetical protein
MGVRSDHGDFSSGDLGEARKGITQIQPHSLDGKGKGWFSSLTHSLARTDKIGAGGHGGAVSDRPNARRKAAAYLLAWPQAQKRWLLGFAPRHNTAKRTSLHRSTFAPITRLIAVI